ncbi:MAG: cytidylate kinase-like family protein [Eubacteriales bacterium]|jgi:cytidylate kinase
MDKFVITVQRQFGSLGRPIAKRMSEILGIKYYDRDIVDQAAKQLNLPVSVVDDEEEKAEEPAKSAFSFMQYPLGKGTSDRQDQIFEAQKNIIKFLAGEGNCIIVGRCADFILSEMENAVHIYIYASYEARYNHCLKDLGMDADEARRMIREVDKARDSYHMQYAGFLPDDKRYKDILIDSSLFGVEGTAQFLAEGIRRKFSDILEQ